MDNKEWSSSKKWNPFNSDKLLAQTYRWREIRRGYSVPQPSLVTIDPINICNLHCVYCNAGYILEKNNKQLSKNTLLNLADFLKEWHGSSQWAQKGVESICIAGGGEPLINKDIGEFVERCVSKGIEVGIVTNGTLIDRFLEPLSKCTWVGVSVDAGTKESFEKLKKVDMFDRVIENIRKLIDYSKEKNTRLNMKIQGYGVSYKFLLHPYNVYDVKMATEIAKEIGCRNFHLRPVGIPWNHSGQLVGFTSEMIQDYDKQIEEARKLEDNNFGIFGITHKFNSRLEKQNCFNRCHAVFMTCVITPSFVGGDTFNLELCCDRRGDKQMLLGESLSDVNEIGKLWGSEKHWKIFDSIDVTHCPRCTYIPHNIIYENVIEKDNMTYRFI
jgi:MoaA/NifB/PqqE/SkfB family radical SAM enzyme